MPMLEIILLLLCAALVWMWLDSLKAREVAIREARIACEAEGLLLLDDTVAIAAVRLARDDDGHIRLQRAYDFEYSDTGNNRRDGSVLMLGRRVLLSRLGSNGRLH